MLLPQIIKRFDAMSYHILRSTKQNDQSFYLVAFFLKTNDSWRIQVNVVRYVCLTSQPWRKYGFDSFSKAGFLHMLQVLIQKCSFSFSANKLFFFRVKSWGNEKLLLATKDWQLLPKKQNRFKNIIKIWKEILVVRYCSIPFCFCSTKIKKVYFTFIYHNNQIKPIIDFESDAINQSDTNYFVPKCLLTKNSIGSLIFQFYCYAQMGSYTILYKI